MNALKAATALLIATNTLPSAIVVNGLDVGEEVCYTGYIMDQCKFIFVFIWMYNFYVLNYLINNV